jgi:hypothetical protein
VTQGGQQSQGEGQQEQQQQQDPLQLLTHVVQEIRKVQNFLELNQPNATEAIKLQREAGDIVWQVVQHLKQQQQQQQ